MQSDQDQGRDFETRALALARARHDPLRLQGAVTVNNREVDGVFIDSSSITVYEFTVQRKLDKAKHDGVKIAETIKTLTGRTENRFKSAIGFFVTADEPTADQREAIAEISKRQSVKIHAISYIQLQQQLIDVEDYIAKRINAPFGSAASNAPGQPRRTYVEPYIQLSEGSSGHLDDLIASMEQGRRIALVGDYGIGKSEAFREIFFRLRKEYFRAPHSRQFPVHINLRDCYGLKNPSEIFRRHAEEIGFATPDQLVSAWRAGRIHLILDGFDEMVPIRWVGSVKKLGPVRRGALAPIRELIEQTPANSGIAISGRPQYFSGVAELADCLAIPADSINEMQDFNEHQAEEFSAGMTLPEWLPTRPLMIGFYRDAILGEKAGGQGASAAQGWGSLIRLVARREAQRVSTIDADTYVDLFARIASTARRESDGREISVGSMEGVFNEVCGYSPDEEGLQALLRLPGLTTSVMNPSNGPQNSDHESRSFVDEELANAAYAIDLAKYVEYPFSGHPMADDAGWVGASVPLVWEIAAEEITDAGFDGKVVRGAIRQRVEKGMTDAVLVDLLGVSDALGTKPERSSIPVSGVILEVLRLGQEASAFDGASFSDCVIENIDITESPLDPNRFPYFRSCNVGRLDGASEVPGNLQSRFSECDISEFVAGGGTVASIVSLSMSKESKVALAILRKVYAQAGSARRVSALSRGLPLDLREIVPTTMDRMLSAGLIVLVSGSNEELAVGVRGMRARVLDTLKTPSRVDELFNR